MKRIRKIIFNVIAVIMICATCFGLTACEDIKTLRVTLNVYSADDGNVVEKTLDIDLYRHLAPDTVDHIIDECVNKNYYDNAIFYKTSAESNNGILMGDIFYDSENEKFINKSPLVPAVDGEFENGTTKGSNLKVEEGSIALWRSWGSSGDYKTNAFYETGRATWLMPTSTFTNYDGYFCVFGQMDIEDEAWTAIRSLFVEAYNEDGENPVGYEEYVVYYTGTYDATKANENFGLEFNCLSKEDFDDLDLDEEDYFTAEYNKGLVCYNKQTIQIPFVEIGAQRTLGVSIKSVKLI